jgi:2-polyprenyl-3-methyl-5-hydroxy-6-metoxy-1,4-benzoquinol methylase
MTDLDHIAQQYHDAQPPDLFIENACQHYEVPFIVQALGPNCQVLDLGLGDGLIFAALAEAVTQQGGHLTCVDGSTYLVDKYADQQTDHVSVTFAMFEEYQTAQRFDVIVASHVLEHVDDPIVLLQHLQTLLADGGQLVVIVPNAESIHRRLAVRMGLQPALDTLSARDYTVGHQRVYTLSSLERDLTATGFQTVAHRGFFLKPLANSQLLNYSPALLDALIAVSDELPTEMCANMGLVCVAANDFN